MSEDDREEIGYRQWLLPLPRAVFLLVHGLGAQAGRWEAMGDFFVKKGISSYAAELWDVDRPDMASYRSGHFRAYYSKILRLYDIAVKDNPSKKIFIIGESLGALISFLLVSGRPGLFSGLICVSPAFANKVALAPADYVRVLSALLYNPRKLFALPFDSSMCTRDISYREKLARDDREFRPVSSKLIFEIVLAQARARIAKNRMTIPALFLVAGEDKIVDPRSARAIFNGLAAEDKAIVEFPGMYHSLSIDLGKESVFEEILRWVDRRII